MSKEKANAVMSVRDVMVMTSQRLKQLNGSKEPSASTVNAAKAHCSLVNAYLGPVRVAMQAARMTGAVPDLSYIGIQAKPKQITEG